MVKQVWILAGCLVSAAAADDATRTYVVTDPAGSHVVTEDGHFDYVFWEPTIELDGTVIMTAGQLVETS